VTAASAIYVGSVMHRRLGPRVHQFRYRGYWFLLDLDELDSLSDSLRWFSYNRLNLFSFHDRDHGDGSSEPIRVQIERHLAAAGVEIRGGRVQLLCMPRIMGYCFNPLSIFFCRQADGTLAALVYQVHNTFGERHSYVIPAESVGGSRRQACPKSFFVSPFLDMGMRYAFRVSGPQERVVVGIVARSATGPVLTAVLNGARRDLNDRNLIDLFLRIPAVTFKVIAAIHWEALRLWRRGSDCVGIRPLPRIRSRSCGQPRFSWNELCRPRKNKLSSDRRERGCRLDQIHCSSLCCDGCSAA